MTKEEIIKILPGEVDVQSSEREFLEIRHREKKKKTVVIKNGGGWR